MQYQHPNTISNNPEGFEVIPVKSKKIACDGGSGISGHPRVYLKMDSHASRVVCGYCSRVYVLEEAA